MKYELIELAKPKGQLVTAFIHSPKGNFIIKGGYRDLLEYLQNVNYPFFGKIKHYVRKGRSYYCFCSNFLQINKERPHFRAYYKIYNQSPFTFIKRVRRIPNKWVPEFFTGFDSNTQFLIAADLLEENGLVLVSRYLRTKAEENVDPIVVCTPVMNCK